MKERPILFSGLMVQAILDDRKTQTRRVVKLTPNGYAKEVGGNRRWHLDDPEALLACPYGVQGDRLWVRETFALSVIDPDGGSPEDEPDNYDVLYRADWPQEGYWTDGEGKEIPTPWKPSIHMFRWASRIELEITGVRVERLQDISEEDAKAEGCEPSFEDEHGIIGAQPFYRYGYIKLWESINGPCSWDANPWVWCVDFRRIKP